MLKYSNIMIILLIVLVFMVGCGKVDRRKSLSAVPAADQVSFSQLRQDARTREDVFYNDFELFELMYMTWLLDYRPVYECLPWDYDCDGLINYLDFSKYSEVNNGK